MKIALVVFLPFYIGNIAAQGKSSFKTLENELLEGINTKEMPSIAMAISRHGETIYSRALGWADIEARIPATTSTSYQIASVSKVMTATGIMLLHDRGVLNIDDKATKYIAPLKFGDEYVKAENVKIRNLLNHTSGLGTYFDIFYSDENNRQITFEEAFKEFGRLHHPPGTISEYSNLGYGLLDHIISNTSGMSFGKFMDEELFKPLGMSETYVQGYSNQSSNKEEAKKYDADLKVLPELKNNTPGAGNIFSSVSDLIKFGNYHLGNTKARNLLSEQSIREMQSYRDPKALFHYHDNAYYGLGWYVKQNDNGYKVLWHEGGMMGASATLKIIPEEGIVIAVIINSSNRSVCNYTVDELSKIVLPNYEPTPLNEATEVANYTPFQSDSTFFGKWEGTIFVDGLDIPFSLEFNEGGKINASYLDYTYRSYFTQNSPLPNNEELLFGLTNQGSFIGLFLGSLPYQKFRAEWSHLLSLKLLKRDNKLIGTVVALPAAPREYYAYPFHVELMKKLSNDK